MIKKLLLSLSFVFIFSGCKKETDVAGLLVGKWNYNASSYEYNGKQVREAANDCSKKSFIEFASGGAYHGESYGDQNEHNTCRHSISDQKSYQYDAASKKITLTGGKRTYAYKVISISNNKLVIQYISEDETLPAAKDEYIR